MSPGPSHPDPQELEAEGLFRNVCRRALRDRVVSDDERRLVEDLRRFLAIPPERAQVLLAEAREDVGRQPVSEVAPLEREEVFRAACSLAWMDDGVEPEEQALLDRLAAALCLDRGRARELQEEVRQLHLAALA